MSAAELEEPDVWATLTKHDSVIFRDNDFEVFLNPTGDTLNYFEFEINALNTGWDLFLPKPYLKAARPTTVGRFRGCARPSSIDGTLNDPTDSRPRMERRDCLSLERFPRAERHGAARTRRRVACQFLTRGVADPPDERQVRETAGFERGQLGLVAAGRRSTCTSRRCGDMCVSKG